LASFIWDFEDEARRIQPVADGTGLSEAQFAELIEACRLALTLVLLAGRRSLKCVTRTLPAAMMRRPVDSLMELRRHQSRKDRIRCDFRRDSLR
jgi:hypothetical protein